MFIFCEQIIEKIPTAKCCFACHEAEENDYGEMRAIETVDAGIKGPVDCIGIVCCTVFHAIINHPDSQRIVKELYDRKES